MYKADDIAKYIVNYSNDNGIEITNLKLQLLMYYIQAYFITEKNQILFEDDLVKFRFGPVVRSVYSFYRCYTNQPIERQSYINKMVFENHMFQSKTIEFSYRAYTTADKLMMSTIIEKMKDYAPWDLVHHVQNESTWRNTENIGDIIPVDAIRSYFISGTNKNRIFGIFDL